jgi:hypothetical protein
MNESPTFPDRIVSPTVEELVAERIQQVRQHNILLALEARFGPVPEEVSAAVRLAVDEAELSALVKLAASCPDLDTFRAHLHL